MAESSAERKFYPERVPLLLRCSQAVVAGSKRGDLVISGFGYRLGDLGRGRLGGEALAQGHGCRYLRWSDGAQLGVEPVRKQRLERRSVGRNASPVSPTPASTLANRTSARLNTGFPLWSAVPPGLLNPPCHGGKCHLRSPQLPFLLWETALWGGATRVFHFGGCLFGRLNWHLPKVKPPPEGTKGRFPRFSAGEGPSYLGLVSVAGVGGVGVSPPLSSDDERLLGASSKYRSCWSRSRGNSCLIAPMLLS